MNVMVYNKYKDLLLGLDIEVMKTMEGVYNVDEIIDTFTNFYYDKMILDITAIRDYQNIDNLQNIDYLSFFMRKPHAGQNAISKWDADYKHISYYKLVQPSV